MASITAMKGKIQYFVNGIANKLYVLTPPKWDYSGKLFPMPGARSLDGELVVTIGFGLCQVVD